MVTASVRSSSPRTRLLIALLIGAGVAVALGTYGRVHDPTGRSLVSLFFTATINLKVWFATAAFGLAMFQEISGLTLTGKLGKRTGGKRLARVHRASGTLAFLIAVPVAYHCLWALGFREPASTRVLVHGLAGCVFFGALVTKILIVRGRAMPNIAFIVAGGLLFASITVVWLTSSLWFFTTQDFPGL
jgi:Family of unknown function (DUF6529)